MEYRETINESDTRSDILETLAGGEPHVFIVCKIDRETGEIDLKVDTGGGIPDAETVRNLLRKTLAAMGG